MAQAQVSFLYGTSISSPPASTSQLGTPPWLQVLIEDSGANEVLMTITPFFQDPAPPADPLTTYPSVFVSELAFNLNLDTPASVVYAGDCFSVEASICSNFVGRPQNGIFTGANNQGVSGSGQTSGYDLSVNLPPPPGSAPNVLNAGDVISFKLAAPSLDAGTFTSASFLAQTSNAGDYYTVAKIQGLRGNPNSTVISGEPQAEPPIPPETEVPAPLPLLGAASALAFSRRLRLRRQLHRRAQPVCVSWRRA